MNIVEEAIVFLSSRCDGAYEIDGAGWNKIDSRIGHSLSDQLKEGRSLTLKQRQLVNRIIRKYKRQFPNWEQIEPELTPWVKAAEKEAEVKKIAKAKAEEGLPKLDFKEGKFYLYTTYESRSLAKRIPRGRWIAEDKAWRYLSSEPVITAITEVQADLKTITPAAIRILKKSLQQEAERQEKIKRVVTIKMDQEVDLNLPLKTKPFDHQLKAMKIATTLDHSALLMEQGTGKTLAAIGTVVYRYLKGQVKRVLVIAPKSVLPEWARQIKEHTDLPYKAAALDGKKKKETLDNWEDGEGINIISINYESTWRLTEELINWKPDMIICDESQKIKNARSEQSKAIHKIAQAAKYRMILTGTPVSQTPLDFFSQYKFLDPQVFGYSYPKFRDRYAIMGGYGNYQVVGYQNEEELAEKAHSIAYRVTKEEAVDLPEAVDQTLYVDLEPKAQKLYDEMAEEAILKLAEEESVTAPIVLTQLLRLQQITGGFLKSDETEELYQVSNSKLSLLKETVEDLIEAGKKLVIFARFVPEVESISNFLKELGVNHRTLTGKTKDRGEAINSFQNNPDCKVFIAQISTGGVGITLTAADTAIFYSLNFSLNDYEQAKARIHRIGQTKKVTYIHLVARHTVDEEVTERLRSKKEVAVKYVDDLKNLFIKGEGKMAKQLESKLNQLKEQLENGEEVTVTDVNTNEATGTEEVKETKKNKKNKKEKAPKAEKAPKEPKEKKEKAPKEKKEKVEKEPAEDLVTVAQLSEELGIAPADLRKKLRKSGLEKPSGRWEWTQDHADLDVIRTWTAEEDEAAE
jgi:SNF2 family DNA or RNA helicase